MMPIEAELQTYSRCWSDVIRFLGRPILLLPFAVVGLIKAMLLLCIFFFWDSRIAGFMVPALRSLGGEGMLHYPSHVQALPGAFILVEIFTMVLVGFALMCWAVFMMIDTLNGERRAFLTYAIEVTMSAPAIAVLAVCFEAAAVWLPASLRSAADSFGERPKIQLILMVGSYAISLMATWFLAFAPSFLRKARRNAYGAMLESYRFVRSNALPTLPVVAAVVVPDTVLWYLASHAASVEGGPRESWVLGFLLIRVLVGVITWFYLLGSAASMAGSSDRA